MQPSVGCFRASAALTLKALLVATWLTLAAPASACNFWQIVAFSDGAQGCLTDYPVSKAAGPVGNVGESVPRMGVFVIAMPINTASCPAVVGMVAHPGVLTITQGLAPVGDRASDAIRRCEIAVRDAKGNTSQCACQAVVLDGTSPLSKSAFETLARGGTAPQPAVASKPTIDPPQRPASSVAAPAPVVAEVLKRASEPVAIATTAPPPVNRPTAPAQADAPPKVPPPTVALTNPDAAATAHLQGQLADLRVKLEALMKERVPTATAQAREAPKVPHLTARALVIGNSGYTSFPALPNPRNDARDIAEKLRSFNIDVDLVVDADRDTLIRALNDYSARAVGRDVNILFYAGHGVQVDGVNYLVPTNMRGEATSAGYIKLAGIALNAALEYLPAKTRLVFLDACRDNPVSRGLVATRGGAAVGLAPVAAPGGTLIAYSTKDGATAEDGFGANSPYSAALLQHLDSAQDISLVLRQVRQTVMRTTSNRQEPWEYGSLVGEQLVLSQMSKP
jgi:hypothetical protein